MRAYNGSPLADLPAITKALNMRAIYKLIEAHLDEYRNLVESEIRRDRADEATT